MSKSKSPGNIFIDAAALKTKVKSFVESLFSRYEKHISKVNRKGATKTTGLALYSSARSDFAKAVN